MIKIRIISLERQTKTLHDLIGSNFQDFLSIPDINVVMEFYVIAHLLAYICN